MCSRAPRIRITLVVTTSLIVHCILHVLLHEAVSKSEIPEECVTRDTGLNLGLFKDPVINHELDWLR